MSKQLIVLGAGYTGKRVLDAVLTKLPDWSLLATSRSPDLLSDFHARGVHTAKLDLLDGLQDDLASLTPHVHRGAWVIYSAPTLYRTYEPARHVEPLQGVLAWARKVGCKGVIYLSSTSVYGDYQGEWVEEQSERRPTSALGKMRRDLEDVLLGWSGDVLTHMYVARIVGIYGPGRTLADYIAKGRYRLIDGGQKITNRVHVDDLVSALLAMLERGQPGHRVYNICDGNPLPVKDLVELLVRDYGVAHPEACTLEAYAEARGENVAARWKNSYRCTNERLRTELGWQPQYEDARDGLRAIMSQQSRDEV